MNEPPYRLCCGQQHWGPVCPDGKVMCCQCFERVDREKLYTDTNTTTWDVCQACHEAEQKAIAARGTCCCTECSGCKEGWCDYCTPDVHSAGHSRLCPLRETA
jgi:hypothetical protein